MAFGVWCPLVPCENVEAFKASFADARFLNHRSFQINAVDRLAGVVWDGFWSLVSAGAVRECEAFKASFADARLLNQRSFQIKTHTRLTEGVCIDFGEFGVRWCCVGMR